MATDWNLAWAFARQARSDLEAREVLIRWGVNLPECHQLHYLQMACEKICKAQLLAEQEMIGLKHSYIAGPLPKILDVQLMMEGMNRSSRRYLGKEFRNIARQIELLAPAVTHDGKRHDNTEYPWKDKLGCVFVPMDFRFSNLNLKNNPGPKFLKMLARAVVQLEDHLRVKATKAAIE